MQLKALIPFAALAAATTKQAANFLLSSAAYPGYGCGEQCQKAIAQSVLADIVSVGLDFDASFYATAANLSTDLPPGAVLKLDTVNANSRLVPSGTSLFRLQYTSRDLDGSVIPAAAFIALPQANPRRSDGTYPVVAWAHGTVGLFAGCAPSNGPALYDYGTWAAAGAARARHRGDRLRGLGE